MVRTSFGSSHRQRKVKTETKPTMTGGGRINWAGEEHFGYSRPSGPCLDRTFNAIMTGAAAGTFFGTAQAAWTPDPITTAAGKTLTDTSKSEFRPILRTIARPALLFSAAAGAFASTECIAESFRGKGDAWNSLIGGMAAGAVIGATTRRADIMTSAAFAMGLFIFALDYTGEDTVRDPVALRHKRFGVLPETHVESEAVARMKEAYPQHKSL